jgi:acyl-CoA synthetase (AMP-forming)/AMP-acid ligase II
MNVLDRFIANAAEFPERTAVIDGSDQGTTYGALRSKAAALASEWTAAGLVKGDRVLVAVRVDADLYATLAALWSIGAVAVFPEPALGLSGLKAAIEATSPRASVSNGAYRFLPWISKAMRRIPLRLGTASTDGASHLAACDVEDDHPALISFTSGTSGRPKAIVRSHGFLVAQDAAVSPLLRTEPYGVDLVGFPVFVVSALGRGDVSVLPDWRTSRPGSANARRIAHRCRIHGVRRLLLNPAVAERLLRAKAPEPVTTLFVGGGPVFPTLIDRLREWSPSLTIVPVYGSTEAEPIAHHEIVPADVHDDGTNGLVAGHVADGTRLRIVDDEIQVAGDHVVKGYLDPSHDVTTKVRDEDGRVWHRTGDAGRLDDRGRLVLLGRLASRAAGLWPFPVEAAAARWRGVRRSALVELDGQAMLVVEGSGRRHGEWDRRFAAIGGKSVLLVKRIPVDRRHGSKVDMVALKAMIER